ncbi:hypothetical protein MLD38_000307 [Melastoma candidum]|uniref:Uncharacterized protein n=1 Tax=Melastoma candidum TaxID=119954 RepID=A0ACB9SA41_9MYRT|nr:hypothetical protein MLD38_000307 [Melastoma candidum]
MQSSFGLPLMIAVALSTYTSLPAKDRGAVSPSAAEELPTNLLLIHGFEIHRSLPSPSSMSSASPTCLSGDLVQARSHGLSSLPRQCTCSNGG